MPTYYRNLKPKDRIKITGPWRLDASRYDRGVGNEYIGMEAIVVEVLSKPDQRWPTVLIRLGSHERRFPREHLKAYPRIRPKT